MVLHSKQDTSQFVWAVDEGDLGMYKSKGPL